ncbi:TPR repeat protein [Cordyceps javanica]|nr:TPR repeat protein [Cordyceps javanica]
MRRRTHHGGTVKEFLLAADAGGDTNDNASRVGNSSTEIMTDSDGGDSLDDDEARSAPSDSTGSLVELVVPDWDMEDSEEWEAVEDDDDGDGSGMDEVGEVGEVEEEAEVEEEGASENRDDNDEGSRNSKGSQCTCSSDVPGVTGGCSPLIGCAHGTVSCLEILISPLQQLAREAGQHGALHYHPRHRCCRRRGSRATWVPPRLRRASGPLVQRNTDFDASPLSPNWRRGTPLTPISLLESNRQAARASILRVEAIEEFDEADRTDYKLFRRLVHDQLAICREQRNEAAIDEFHCTFIGKLRRIFGHRHWKTITAMHDYGRLLSDEKRYAQAEALYETLVHEADQDRGPDSVALLCIFNALGTVYAKRQKLKVAETIFVRAMAGFEELSGAKDVRTLTAAFNLGGVYQNRGKLSHAIRMYHTAAYGFKDVMGTSYETTIRAFTQLAALCSARRALPAAEKAYTLALQGLEETAKQDSVDALILKLDLGVLYRDAGRLEDAETLIGDAWHGDFAACDDEYSAMSYAAYFGLGNLLRVQRRLAEAEAMYRQAWDGARSVGGPQHATSCTVADALGSLCEEQGKYEEAEEIYKQSLAPGESCLDRRTSFVLRVNFDKMAGYV